MSDTETSAATRPAPRRSNRGHGLPSLEVLAMRVSTCEDNIADVRSDLKTALSEFTKLKDRINIQTALIIGAMVAGGLIKPEVAAVLKSIFGS